MKKIVTICGVLLACGCGASPSAPDEGAAIAGRWTGTLQLTSVALVPIEAQLNQSGRTVTGTWTSTALVWRESWRGTLTGTVSRDGFTGTLTVLAPDPVVFDHYCEASAAVSGSARTGDTVMTWTSDAGTGCWIIERGLTLTLQR